MVSQLSSLKGAALKTLAFRCGIQVSGTKAALIQRIQNEAQIEASREAAASKRKRTPRQAMRIVSIDMGIRNLAYCVLSVPEGHGKPTIEAWKRLAISSAPVAPSLSKAELKVAGARTKEAVQAVKEVEKESFEPKVMSKSAYQFSRKLLEYQPTHVLIERQRFRSMGSSHILEWTVRVNMLESMLYAVLQTLKEEKAWHGGIIPIAPGRVGPFWLEEEGMAFDPSEVDEIKEAPLSKTRTSKLAKIQNKGAKIDLVRNWLASSDRVELASGEVSDLAAAYLEKWVKGPGAPKGKRALADSEVVVEKMGKLDDLADSLLQGMAFLRWEENKQTIREVGWEPLLAFKSS